MIDQSAATPVFILGMTRRSGTNFLWRLLDLHPHIVTIPELAEDFSLQNIQLLSQYVDRTCQNWDPAWGYRGQLQEPFMQSLGQCILNFILRQHDAPIETSRQKPLLKTPSVQNIERFFDFFPQAYLLITVRDGRDVVESCMRSFNFPFEESVRAWNQAAQAILGFDRVQHEHSVRYRVVRYERILSDRDHQLTELLQFLKLDPLLYDFDKARQLPAYGSSALRGEEEAVHWRPVNIPVNHQFTGQWESWNLYRKQRFNWIAGQSMSDLGYQPNRPESMTWGWALLNRCIDQYYEIISKVQHLKRRVTSRFKRIFGKK